MSFVFETIKETDLEKCVDVVFSSLSEQLIPAHRNREMIKRMIFGSHAISLVAKKNGKIVGLISGVETFPTPTISFLSVTDEESARQGLGKILIDKFIENVKKRMPGVQQVSTMLTTDNTSAISLFSSEGFIIKGFIKERLVNKDVVILTKSV